MDVRCGTCKHGDLGEGSYPCNACNGYGKWEPVDDAVQHPHHYTHGKYECIDVMVDTFGKEAVQHFCVLNSFKYVWRSEHKNGLEDIKKAWWYLDKYLQLEGKKDGE